MSALHSSSKPTSSPSSSQLPISIVSIESDESDLSESDIELSDIALEHDLDYQTLVNTIADHDSIPAHTGSSSFQQYSITLPAPPVRPSHFLCDPAWHFDNARSPINSDGEEQELSDYIEEGVLCKPLPANTQKKNKKKKKKKSRASRQKREDRQEEFKKTKTEEVAE